ncbi:MAG TPA: tetratricopeptide repeat protein [Candidatus Sulfomarinibacteraceae bacterium]|nr:tetratricopeptide repeat protein [Candidatus Sulfomarinibacteraceae bacterium]
MIPGPDEARERDLLARLGLDERATTEDVARTRDQLQAFLATAPKSLRGWARTQASAADEAFTLLSDPTAWRGTGALPAPHARSAAQPDGPATPPVRRALRAAGPAATPATASEGDDDAEFDAMLAELTPSMHRDRFGPPRAALNTGTVRISGAVPAFGAAPRRISRPLLAVAGLVAVVAVGIGVYQFGAPAAASAPPASPAASAGLDQARVAELMGRIQTNPDDTAALLELGDAFFQAGDYGAAVTWLDKLVVLEPNNVRGRLALGAAQFNLGDVASAETNWVAVLDVDADNVEAHYDLGFLFLNEDPPDIDGVNRHWSEVVRLAPGTDIATVVQQHLDALVVESAPPDSGASAAPSAGASAAPSAGVSAAPSPTASAEPSGTPEPSVFPKP